MQGLDFEMLLSDREFASQLLNNERRIGSFSKKAVKDLGSIEEQFKQLGQVASGYFAFNELKGLGTQLINIRGEFQQLQIAFETMLGSKGKADQLMSEVVSLAAQTPFSLREAASATKQLLAYGFASETVVEELRKLGDIAAGVGAPIGDLAYLMGTLKTQGRAMTQDINQLAGRGIPIWDELAKVLKVNVGEVRNFVEAGKVGFTEVQQVVRNLTAEGSIFGGLMEKQSKSLTGMVSALGDAVDMMFNEIGQSQEGALASSIGFATSVVENYQPILDTLKVIIASYGSYKAALLLTAAVQSSVTAANIIDGYVQLAKNVGLATAAQKAFNSAALANPYAIAAAALLGLVTAIVVFNKEVSQADKLQSDYNSKLEQSARADELRRVKVDELRKAVQNENLTQAERKKKLDELIALSPQHLKSLNLANIATGYATDLILSYNKAMAAKNTADTRDAQIMANQAKIAAIRSGAMDKEFGPTAGQRTAFYQAAAGSQGQFDVDKETKLLIERNKQEALAALTDQTKKLLAEDGRSVDQRRKLRREAYKEELSDVKKSVADYDKAIEELREAQKKSTSTEGFKAYQRQIEEFESKRRAITGELTKQQKEMLKDAEKSGPFGSIAYWEHIAQMADEIINKTPDADTSKIAEQVRIKTDAEQKAEEIRKKNAVKSFEEELADKRQKYEQFERWANAYTLESAKLQFSGLVAENQSYADYLNAEIAKLEAKRNNGQLNTKDASALDILNNERDRVTAKKSRLEVFNESLDSATTNAESLTEALERLRQKQETLGKPVSTEDYAMQQSVAERIVQTENARKALLQDYLKSVEGSEQRETQIRKHYSDLRNQLDEQTADKKADAYIKASQRINNDEKEDLKNDKTNAARASKEFKEFQKIVQKNYDELNALDVKQAREKFAKLTEGLDKESRAYKEHYEELLKIEQGYNDRRVELITSIASAAAQLGDIFSDVDGGLGNAGSNIAALATQVSSMVQQVNQISKTMKDSGKSFNLQNVGDWVGLIVQVIGFATKYNKRVKQELATYVQNYKNFLQELAIAQNETIGKASKTNPFYQDYDSMIAAGVAQYDDALTNYQTAIDKLNQGRAIVGYNGGFFKKDKNVYQNLMERFPELVDAAGNLNVELAKSLVGTGQLDEKTKALVQNAIDWEQAMQDANNQIWNTVLDLTGQIGDTLTDSMVNAFANGTDAAMAWGDTVGDIIGQIVKKTTLMRLMQPALDQLSAEMATSIGKGGDANIVDDLDRFGKYGLPAFESAFAVMQQYSDWAKSQGYGDIFGSGNQATQATPAPLQGAITGASAESIDLLNGQINAVRIQVADGVNIARASLIELTAIKYNTGATDKNTRELYSMRQDLAEIRRLLGSDWLRATGG